MKNTPKVSYLYGKTCNPTKIITVTSLSHFYISGARKKFSQNLADPLKYRDGSGRSVVRFKTLQEVTDVTGELEVTGELDTTGELEVDEIQTDKYM